MMGKVSSNTLRILVLLAVFAATVLFFASQIDGYLNARLFNRISGSVAVIALIAVGQAFVVLTRNIDLSIGSVVGCSAYFTGGILIAYPDLPPILVPLLAMAIGALFGAVNGFFVARFHLPSIIVTLATLAIFRSILVQSSDGSSITTEKLPVWLTSFATQNAFTVGDLQMRWIVVISILVVLTAHVFLTRFRAGRRFFAIGSNPDAAAFAGINAGRTIFLAFVISGALAGLAGFMFLARFGNITVVAGGSGNVLGVLIGAALIDLIDTSLVRWELVSEFWREAVLGLLILTAVVLDTVLIRRLLDRRRHKAATLAEGRAP
jgi:rhamnose transport system permease protein